MRPKGKDFGHEDCRWRNLSQTTRFEHPGTGGVVAVVVGVVDDINPAVPIIRNIPKFP